VVLGSVVVYGHPEERTAAQRRAFERALFGHTDRSKNGRYAYERAGYLTGKPHVVVRRAVLLVPLDEGDALAAFVRARGAWAWVRRVELSAAEARRLYPLPR